MTAQPSAPTRAHERAGNWSPHPPGAFARLRGQIRSFRRLAGGHNSLGKTANLLRAEADLRLKRTQVRSLPYRLYIDPTNMCNLRCPLCATGQQLFPTTGRMGMDVFRSAIDQLRGVLYRVGLFNWGEPLLHPDILEMIAYARERDMATAISSNLSFRRPGLAQGLVESGLEHLIVSLDGTTQEVYEQYRVGGRLDLVLDNVREIVDRKRSRGSRFPFVEIQFIVMRQNEHQVPDVERLGPHLGADTVTLIPAFVNIDNEADAAKWLPREERLSRYDYTSKADRLLTQVETCEWLYRTAVVQWDGKVAPCCYWLGEETTFGDLRRDAFAEIWNNELFREARRVFHAPSGGPPDLICTSCRGCPTPTDENAAGRGARAARA